MGSLSINKLKREPLKKGSSIDHLKYIDSTPIIGREYPTAKLKDILKAPNAEEQLRDLAITICERGVVFFRAPQDDLSIEEQKYITDLLGKLTGRPPENGLHVHPLYNDPNNLPMADGTTDKQIYVINSEAAKKLYATMKNRPGSASEPRDLGREWHSDSLFENCPSDFSFLRMQDTPPAGGDTLWVSGYELYDRLSPPYQKFLETLTATCAQPVFESACKAGGYDVMSPRGSPLNKDYEFSPSHPVIRTHPVTGWKSLFAGVGLHVSRINDVYSYEDQMIRDYVLRLITRNHDCIARMHWTRGACAIWSNVCTLHAATPDTHLVEGIRTGVRASGTGEVPYLDPASTGRREALGMPQF
ncbi:putative alpha-ketoglutarate-dependent sulfonate dioxygenase [Daldinia childiae]|uniref:putative alpha-ketoglutarate-dependent sulfonate dioxygenase n=1 Tax=Daldinia childiae TaxID=326645 RepID=UPI001446B308|nr:putative alpha-ketoglutarate-dependent sulfonate dioxygenase [Daldinia childiae]KAF3067349.1 putative alpha-ketoglutarate-dependent sulfonate dioxygenase [Daldinia childiae]